jgi:hypothetical protein
MAGAAAARAAAAAAAAAATATLPCLRPPHPQLMVTTRFAASLPTGNSSQRKEAQNHCLTL